MSIISSTYAPSPYYFFFYMMLYYFVRSLYRRFIFMYAFKEHKFTLKTTLNKNIVCWPSSDELLNFESVELVFFNVASN